MALLRHSYEEAVRSVDPALLRKPAPPTATLINGTVSAAATATASETAAAACGSGGGSVPVVLLGDLLTQPAALVSGLYAAGAEAMALAALDGDDDGRQRRLLPMAAEDGYGYGRGGGVGGPAMLSDFHASAAALLAAVDTIAHAAVAYGPDAFSQGPGGGGAPSASGVVAVPVSLIRQRLVKGWLEQPLGADCLPAADRRRPGADGGMGGHHRAATATAASSATGVEAKFGPRWSP